MMTNEELQTNLEQEYYGGQDVSHAITNEVITAQTAAGFQWIEVLFPDGKNRLCIETPCTVKNGPADKYKARAI